MKLLYFAVIALAVMALAGCEKNSADSQPKFCGLDGKKYVSEEAAVAAKTKVIGTLEYDEYSCNHPECEPCSYTDVFFCMHPTAEWFIYCNTPPFDGDEDDEEPQTCSAHAECGETMYCKCGLCANNSKACFKNSDCVSPCQTCRDGSCIGDPTPCANPVCLEEEKEESDYSDSDGEPVDYEPPNETDLKPCSDQTSCPTDSYCVDGYCVPYECSSSIQCHNDETCRGGRCVINSCSDQTCTVGTGKCNKATGHCECCDPFCAEGQACNYDTKGWYCAAPCNPPCPQNYACAQGVCVQLKCPLCPSGYRCAADTCYVCALSPDADETDKEPEPETEGDGNDALLNCSTSANCPAWQHCFEGYCRPYECFNELECKSDEICSDGFCIRPKCDGVSCGAGEGKCNPATGKCECCDPMCALGQHCNYNTQSWYCGVPCNPPCPQNYACSEGFCVQLKCPACQSGYRCGADTCWVCQPTGGDYE